MEDRASEPIPIAPGIVALGVATAYRRTKWALAIRGVISLAVGRFLITRPGESTVLIALGIALWAIADGMMEIQHGLAVRHVMRTWWALLVGGLASIAVGLVALVFSPTLPVFLLAIWAGVWLLTAGGLALSAGFQQRRIGQPWASVLTCGVFAVLIGILVFKYPLLTFAVVEGLIGAFAVVGGIVMVLVAGAMELLEDRVKRRETSSHLPAHERRGRRAQ